MRVQAVLVSKLGSVLRHFPVVVFSHATLPLSPVNFSQELAVAAVGKAGTHCLLVLSQTLFCFHSL